MKGRRRPALVFIGFMGSGKSTAARLAAAEVGAEPIDTDGLVEREIGMPIAAFFAERGEGAFREREEAVCSEALDSADGGAIAIGGGAVRSQRVREALGRHVVILLEVTADAAWARVGEGHERPLAADRAAFERLHAERAPVYEQLADAVLPSGDDRTVLAALPSLLALRDAPRRTRMAWASSASGAYPVYVGRGLLDAGFWPQLEGRRFCVTDTTVGPLYGEAVEPLAARIELEPGEEYKTLAEAEHVWRALVAAGMTRRDHLVALGGGVVGDLAGFCAATYQRGVPVAQVPTSLAAQVDSAYGGKTGVDLPEAKNYVGAYHPPAAVLADPSTLSTLPREELAAGLAEVVKTALIAGGSLWDAVRRVRPESLEPREVDDLVWACARTKLAIVAEDERDAGRRAILNLGHTVGHAIETATGYRRYRHGEAVGLGLLAALRLSGADELRREVRDLLGRAGLPTQLDHGVALDAVLAAAERDKKRDASDSGEVGFVLLERPGEPRFGERVDPARVRDAVEELRGEPAPG